MTRLGTPTWIGRQADAVGGVHGLQHVVHQFAKLVVHLVDGLGDFLQTRVRDGEYFTNSHAPKIVAQA